LDYYTSGGVTGCPALLVEPAATNLALHSRDLSNAVWSGTNITTAKNAVGADGVASGATTLTATAASGTVLQALSHASQSRVFSAYVRRVTGTGAIQMTTNGGTNWTTVTISSLYTQVACAAQTVASGTVGFRMAVSGDVIEVDFTQGEVGPIATSPISTTTGTGSRSADVISVSGAVSGSIGQTEGTIYAEVDFRQVAAGTIFVLDDGDPSDFINILKQSNLTISVRLRRASGTIVTIITSSAVALGVHKIALVYKNGDYALYIDGVSAGTSTNSTDYPATALVQCVLSNTNYGPLNDRIRAAALYTTRLTNAELAALTA
jgi:hypothetical protein